MELLDFYADWCGPCQMMKPVVEEFGEKHPELKITPVNIDDEEDLAEQYAVENIPCVVLLKDGKEAGRVAGAFSIKKLEKLLEA